MITVTQMSQCFILSVYFCFVQFECCLLGKQYEMGTQQWFCLTDCQPVTSASCHGLYYQIKITETSVSLRMLITCEMLPLFLVELMETAVSHDSRVKRKLLCVRWHVQVLNLYHSERVTTSIPVGGKENVSDTVEPGNSYM